MSLHSNLFLMQQEKNLQSCFAAPLICNYVNSSLSYPVFSPVISLQTSSRSRPGLLKTGDQGLPWLADSWPSTSLPANGGLGSPKGGSNFGRGGEQAGCVVKCSFSNAWSDSFDAHPLGSAVTGHHTEACTHKQTHTHKLREPLRALLD